MITTSEDVRVDNALITLNAMGDLVEELRVQIEKMRQETREAIGERVRCYEECEATIQGLAYALRQGWIDLGIDELDEFVGWCPKCQADHEKIEKVLNTPASAPITPTKTEPRRTLFD